MSPTDEATSGEELEQVEAQSADNLEEPIPPMEAEDDNGGETTVTPEEADKPVDGDVPPNRLYRFAKKLMDRRELAEDTKDLMVAFLSTSDRAKTEMVRMTAREVRNYLEELRLKEELVNLVRGHSLEVKASFSLKPIEELLNEPESEHGED